MLRFQLEYCSKASTSGYSTPLNKVITQDNHRLQLIIIVKDVTDHSNKSIYYKELLATYLTETMTYF